jgi:conjugative transfer signal peptidase TraF
MLIITLFKANGYILNNTSSFPIGIYKVTKQKNYKKGDLVSFCAPKNETIKKLMLYGFASPNSICRDSVPMLLKKIVALENSEIVIDKNKIYIDGILQEKSTIFLVGRGGNILEKQSTQIIQKGMFWAMSDYNEYSYDSRYFGQIPLENIKGKAEAVFIW